MMFSTLCSPSSSDGLPFDHSVPSEEEEIEDDINPDVPLVSQNCVATACSISCDELNIRPRRHPQHHQHPATHTQATRHPHINAVAGRRAWLRYTLACNAFHRKCTTKGRTRIIIHSCRPTSSYIRSTSSTISASREFPRGTSSHFYGWLPADSTCKQFYPHASSQRTQMPVTADHADFPSSSHASFRPLAPFSARPSASLLCSRKKCVPPNRPLFFSR